jgi:soluble lytic murein transglycosylase-like protein
MTIFQFFRWLLLFSAAGLMIPYGTSADIYKHVDNDGVIHLTNLPSDKNIKYELVLREERILLKINETDIAKYDHLISRASEQYNVDPALVKAVIKAESNFNHKAVSPKGAKGLMQLMPATAGSLQVQDSFHPEENIDGGVRYLRQLLDLFKGDHSLALAAYNAGEGAVAKYRNTIPPYRETHTYVRRVLMYFNQFQNDRL